MDNEEYACPICDKTYIRKDILRRHIKAKHRRASIDPSKVFISNEKVENLAMKTIQCPKCDFIFYLTKMLLMLI